MHNGPVVWQVVRGLNPDHFVMSDETRRYLEGISSVPATATRPVAILKMTEGRNGHKHVPNAIPVSTLGRLFRLNMLSHTFGAPYGTVVIPIALEASEANPTDIALLAGWYKLVVERVSQACGGGLVAIYDLDLAPELREIGLPASPRTDIDKMAVGRDAIAAALLQRERRRSPDAALVRMLSARQAGKREVSGLFRDEAEVLRQPIYHTLLERVGFVFTPNTYDLAGEPTHETVWGPGQRRIKARANEPFLGMLPAVDAPIGVSDYMALRALRALCALGESAIPSIRQEDLISREAELIGQCKRVNGVLTNPQVEHAFICREIVVKTLPTMLGALCPSESEVNVMAEDVLGMLVA